MSIWRSSLIGLAAVAVLAVPALATELGDAAPALKVEKWLKGDAVDLQAGKGKNVYVVEFWATWCGPCKKAIPHLTELQKKYKDQGVIIVGVSVDEDKVKKTRDKVAEFVEKKGDEMAYAVALDDKDRSTNKVYMEEFKAEGIPTAFIVDKSGKLAWMGHPSELDETLPQVLDGKWDVEKAKKADKERRVEAAKREKAEAALQKYFEAVSADTKPDGLDKLNEETLAAVGKDAMLLNALGWGILDNPGVKHRDLKFALKVAKAAYDACEGKDPAIVDTYARGLWDNGQKKEAIEYEKKAIALVDKLDAPDEAKDQMKEDLKESLKKYEAEK
jgi:thiol-disulfide isomerase/thioredoxin